MPKLYSFLLKAVLVSENLGLAFQKLCKIARLKPHGFICFLSVEHFTSCKTNC